MLRLTRTSCLKTGAAQKQPIQVEIVLVHTCMNVSAALVTTNLVSTHVYTVHYRVDIETR